MRLIKSLLILPLFSITLIISAPSFWAAEQAPGKNSITPAQNGAVAETSGKKQALENLVLYLQSHESDEDYVSLGLTKKIEDGATRYYLNDKRIEDLDEETLVGLFNKSEKLIAVENKRINDDWRDLQNMLEARRRALENNRR